MAAAHRRLHQPRRPAHAHRGACRCSSTSATWDRTSSTARREQVAATVFADLDVGTVILDRYKMPGGDERTYTEALAAAIFAGQEPLYADERITVYKVGDSGEPQPYLRWGR